MIIFRVLRDFGFAKSATEHVVSNEVERFTAYLKQFENKPIDLHGSLNLPILNVLWTFSAGDVFEYEDKKLKYIMERMTSFFRVVEGTVPGMIHTVLPAWIFKLFPTLAQRNMPIEIQHDNLAMFRAMIKEHEDTLDEDNPRDFVDASLLEIAKTDDPKSSFYKETGRENLANTINDLFIAGSETTANTLLWGILYMVREQNVQKKIQVSFFLKCFLISHIKIELFYPHRKKLIS